MTILASNHPTSISSPVTLYSRQFFGTSQLQQEHADDELYNSNKLQDAFLIDNLTRPILMSPPPYLSSLTPFSLSKTGGPLWGDPSNFNFIQTTATPAASFVTNILASESPLPFSIPPSFDNCGPNTISNNSFINYSRPTQLNNPPNTQTIFHNLTPQDMPNHSSPYSKEMESRLKPPDKPFTAISASSTAMAKSLSLIHSQERIFDNGYLKNGNELWRNYKPPVGTSHSPFARARLLSVPLPKPSIPKIPSIPPLPDTSSPISASNNSLVTLGNSLSYNPFIVRRRKRITPIQLKELERTYKSTSKPTTQLRRELAIKLGMTLRAVQVWFQNKRAKRKVKEYSLLSICDEDIKREETEFARQNHQQETDLVFRERNTPSLKLKKPSDNEVHDNDHHGVTKRIPSEVSEQPINATNFQCPLSKNEQKHSQNISLRSSCKMTYSNSSMELNSNDYSAENSSETFKGSPIIKSEEIVEILSICDKKNSNDKRNKDDAYSLACPDSPPQSLTGRMSLQDRASKLNRKYIHPPKPITGAKLGILTLAAVQSPRNSDHWVSHSFGQNDNKSKGTIFNKGRKTEFTYTYSDLNISKRNYYYKHGKSSRHIGPNRTSFEKIIKSGKCSTADIDENDLDQTLDKYENEENEDLNNSDKQNQEVNKFLQYLEKCPDPTELQAEELLCSEHILDAHLIPPSTFTCSTLNDFSSSSLDPLPSQHFSSTYGKKYIPIAPASIQSKRWSQSKKKISEKRKENSINPKEWKILPPFMFPSVDRMKFKCQEKNANLSNRICSPAPQLGMRYDKVTSSKSMVEQTTRDFMNGYSRQFSLSINENNYQTDQAAFPIKSSRAVNLSSSNYIKSFPPEVLQEKKERGREQNNSNSNSLFYLPPRINYQSPLDPLKNTSATTPCSEVPLTSFVPMTLPSMAIHQEVNGNMVSDYSMSNVITPQLGGVPPFPEDTQYNSYQIIPCYLPEVSTSSYSVPNGDSGMPVVYSSQYFPMSSTDGNDNSLTFATDYNGFSYPMNQQQEQSQQPSNTIDDGRNDSTGSSFMNSNNTTSEQSQAYSLFYDAYPIMMSSFISQTSVSESLRCDNGGDDMKKELQTTSMDNEIRPQDDLKNYMTRNNNEFPEQNVLKCWTTENEISLTTSYS